MEKYFAKFGIPISVVVVIIVIVVVIVLAIITVKSTKDNNDSILTHMPNDDKRLVTDKYLLSFDKDRNYKKIKIGDIYAYADKLIKKIEEDILMDISAGYIKSAVDRFITSNTATTAIDKAFTAKYDNVINRFTAEYALSTNSTFSIPQLPTNNKDPNMGEALSRARGMLNESKLNNSVKVGTELYNIWSKENMVVDVWNWGYYDSGTFIWHVGPSEFGGLFAGWRSAGQDIEPMIKISPF